MSGEPAQAGDEQSSGWRAAFRGWRRSRPFWAGLWTLLAGLEILSIPLAPLSLMIHEGIAGVSGLLMGVFMVILGLTLWLAPGYRVFAGIATLIFAIASLVLSNFGGFLLGFLLGVMGGAMAVSWGPDGPGRRPAPVPDWSAHAPGKAAPDKAAPDEGSPDEGTTEGGAPEGPGGGPDGSGGGPGDGRGGGPGGPGGSATGRQPEPAPDKPVKAPSRGKPAGTGGPGPSGEPGIDRVKAERTGRMRGNRLRALGALPAGGALLAGGLQPMSASADLLRTHLAGRTNAFGSPAGPSDKSDQPGLSVCSLLDGLLGTNAPTVHGAGLGRPSGDGPRTDGPRASPDAAMPGQRTDEAAPRGDPQARGGGTGPSTAPTPTPSPSPSSSPSGSGLVGAVSGLLGLSGTPDPKPSGTPGSGTSGTPNLSNAANGSATPGRSGTANRSGTPSPSPSPSTSPSTSPSLSASPSASPSPSPSARDDAAHHASDIDRARPPLPRDGGMDEPMERIPLHLHIGGPDAQSPWCLPGVSLDISLGAAKYSVKTAAQPHRVLTPLLVLTGLTFHGIAAVPTAYGPQRVLVFTAFRVDIASLRQTAPLLAPSCERHGHVTDYQPPFIGIPGIGLPLLGMGLPGIGFVDPYAPGPWFPCQGRLEVTAAPWSTTTATGQPVVLLTKVLSGNLLGLLPVTFTPDMPPPLPPGLTLPIPIFFTNVTAYNQFLGADRITIPGLVQQAFS